VISAVQTQTIVLDVTEYTEESVQNVIDLVNSTKLAIDSIIQI
jgi:hypothetical protein